MVSDKSRRGEFDIISSVFRPLAGEGALNLSDDAAWIEQADMVFAKDLVVSGSHFLPDDPPDLIAKKALRVNVSDIVAMGAAPVFYLLGLALPRTIDDAWIDAFGMGLGEDHSLYGLSLIGGDTTRHDGDEPLVISVTMAGKLTAGRPVLRSGARAGDLIAVTGTIGDGGLGLKVRTGELAISEEADTYLQHRYQVPVPRHELAKALAECASGAMDISDGLFADAGHLATASGLDVHIRLEDVPLSSPARTWALQEADEGQARAWLAAAGDDYELLLTADEKAMDRFVNIAGEFGIPVNVIGQCTEGQGKVNVSYGGQPMRIDRAGHDHFRS